MHDAPSAIAHPAGRASARTGGVRLAGDASLLRAPLRVALVGTREPSPEAAAAAEMLACELARLGAVLVSGGARGIDQAAHAGALAAGGRTICCLPHGIGYPRPDLPWAARAEGVLLASLLPPHARPSTSSPVARNRLIAELADAVVASEAGPASGTMHCLRAAFELGRPVFFLRMDGGPELRALHASMAARGAAPLEPRAFATPASAAAVAARARAFAAGETERAAAQGDLFG
ncbi:MAG: DNA-processing protein DprA [Candidatus Sumerlaeia bacterium]|nr:DNA-processing protein DprA [Candidatus Sumerlaeia bacterium]